MTYGWPFGHSEIIKKMLYDGPIALDKLEV